MHLRCDARKHAEVTEDGYIEVRCRSSKCGYSAGIVVIHRFDPCSAKLLLTMRFRDAAPKEQGD